MKSRIIDLVAGGLLFACGALVVWTVCASLKVLWYFHAGMSDVAPVLLPGLLGALAAVGVIFLRRAAGIVGSISMLVLAVLFLPRSLDENLVLLLGGDASIEFPQYIAPTVLLVAAVLVCWRFVFTQRASTRTI